MKIKIRIELSRACTKCALHPLQFYFYLLNLENGFRNNLYLIYIFFSIKSIDIGMYHGK